MTDTPITSEELQDQIKGFCQEKGLEYDEVMEAIQKAIAGAYRREFGDRDKSYMAEYDVLSNKYKVFEVIKIVEQMDETMNEKREMSIMDARLENPSLQVGDELRRDLGVEKEVGFGRIASQVAKQVLIYTVNNMKHTKILQKFKEFIGRIVTVEVDAFKSGGYIVKLGQGVEQTSGYLNKEDLLPIDHFKPGQLIKALIVDITEDENKGSKIKLSRSAPEFVTAIISKEVPEVEAGTVQVLKVVREAGNRTKLLVKVADIDDAGDIDPVGTILGRRNVRLLNIMREISPSLQEKIDVIEYSDSLENMVADALEPAEIERIEFETMADGRTLAQVFCFADESALAVGKRGANVRLASQLLNVEIKINSLEQDQPTAHSPEITVE
jgi:transcription termination/antitermination protein NusA